MNTLVGFWIEFKNRVPLNASCGCRDTRERHPHEFRQSLAIYATKAKAMKAARTLDRQFGQYWTTHVRMARKANQ